MRDSSAVEDGHQLKRHFGTLNLISIGIGAIIGAGIFVVTGQAAALFAGPAIVLSFIVAALICVLAGLCFAELASLIPVSGGAYSYSYVALGEFPAWIVGWSISAQYLVAASTVAVGWSGYFVGFLRDWGLAIPDLVAKAPLTYQVDSGWGFSGSCINLPAVLLVVLLGALVAIGVKAAAHFNNVMVVVKLSAVVLFVAVGAFYIQVDNWTPFIPENTGVFGNFGWSGIFRAAGFLFFAYLGFDTIATLAQETKNPQRSLPLGILGSLAICTIAYIVISLVLTGIVDFRTLNVPDPMSIALGGLPPKFFWVGLIVKLAILSGLASVVLIQILAQTRIFFSISKDGLLPAAFSKLSKESKSPLFSVLFTVLIIAIVGGIFPVEILGQFVSIITLFIFSIVCISVWILRRTHPEYERSFKVPFVPFIPILGALACIAQMCFLPLVIWMQMAIWIGIGLLVYVGYGKKYSKLRQ